ncbi:hypothetical protein SLS60_005764 [Paraconiothyrium brasiliense]|uniref:Protein kinase domain-containing protein n=1 Tax=Paraconiothyrium brasiliense TaxID=300254 RepID=A0ABR3RD56_9PLEO
MSSPLALGPQKLRRLEYRKIFAILLLVGKEKEIPIFIKHRVSDEELPLIPMKVSDEERLLFSGQSKPDEILHCFRSWNATAIHQFEQQQWRVLAPVFKDPENEGVFQRDLDKHGNVFAVKQLLHHRNIGSQDAGLQSEINVLEGILKPQHQHDHLINMLATFRIDGMDYIIFPWAETDLLNYWRWKNPDPTPSRRTVKWLLEQCHGLARALHNIHRWPTTRSSKLVNAASSSGNGSGESEPVVLFGRHGDIKPMNILWIDNGGLGTLKLADFGTARFDAEGAPPPVNLDVATTPNYRAPEFRPDTAVSSSWDIWALGCVYLEFVTWLCYGWEGVDTFADDRLAEDPHHEFRTTTFYEQGEGGPRLKPAVLTHLDELSRGIPYPTVLRLFLDYIMEKMVIVEDQNVNRSNTTELVQRTEGILGEFHFLWVD